MDELTHSAPTATGMEPRRSAPAVAQRVGVPKNIASAEMALVAGPVARLTAARKPRFLAILLVSLSCSAGSSVGRIKSSYACGRSNTWYPRHQSVQVSTCIFRNTLPSHFTHIDGFHTTISTATADRMTRVLGGEPPENDLCGPDEVIYCPPGSSKNEDCKCLPRHGLLHQTNKLVGEM